MKMIVYTVQHENVCDMIRKGGAYFPEWHRTRPFNPSLDARGTNRQGAPSPELLDRVRPQRQRAYFWMAKEYALIKGRRTIRALVYGFLEKSDAENLLEDDEVLLTLDIPDSDLLYSQHQAWSTEILAGVRVTPRSEEIARRMPAGLALEDNWATIFDVTDYTETLQVVFDRIEPHWVVK